jgi:hypothetical protein
MTLIGISAYMTAPANAQNAAANSGRTELIFGTAKPDGTVVSDQEFRAFFDQVVTPRFPKGPIIVKGDTQFQREDGLIVEESVFSVTFLYRSERSREANRRLNDIRQVYMAQFQQESVVRIDDPFGVQVSF